MAIVVAAVKTEAADTDAGPTESRFAVSLTSPPPEPAVFWQRFDYAFDNRANDIFADALQPLNAIRWNVDLRGRDFSDNFRERASSRARGAFIRTAEYGAREAAVQIPFMLWLDEYQGWFADLLRGSIGNVNEETIRPLNAARDGLEQLRWRNEASRGTHYGIRPLRTSPYAYVSQGISDGERTVLLAHVRYYYDRFAEHRVELAFSVPLQYGYSFDVGNSYQFGSHDKKRIAVKLVKEIRGGGVAHVGFELREHPKLIAGITFAW
jgi:hypothetical protein